MWMGMGRTECINHHWSTLTAQHIMFITLPIFAIYVHSEELRITLNVHIFLDNVETAQTNNYSGCLPDSNKGDESNISSMGL